MGDPAGIGPEVIARIPRTLLRTSHPVLVVGSHRALSRFTRKARLVARAEDARGGRLNVLDPTLRLRVVPGRPSTRTGAAALAYLRTALSLLRRGLACGLVTGPVDKTIVARTLRGFVGHTRYLCRATRSKAVTMCLVSPRIRVALATEHVALQRVARILTKRLVLQTIVNADALLRMLGTKRRKIAVCALQPHAESLFGREDARVVLPAVRAARARGIDASGPFPSDSLFAKHRSFDLVVALYHDQGLGPFKMLSFRDGVNVSVGLPFVRTSVDHGTAFDIAGRGKASPASMTAAVRLALRLARNHPNRSW